MSEQNRQPSRRAILTSAGAAGIASLAGCLNSSGTSFDLPVFERTDTSVYTSWLPEEIRGFSRVRAFSPAVSAANGTQHVSQRQVNRVRAVEPYFGVDDLGADHVIEAADFSIITGSVSVESLKQTIPTQLPYERTDSYDQFTFYQRTDDLEQTVAVGRDTALSTQTEYEPVSTLRSVIDTKFGDGTTLVESSDTVDVLEDLLTQAYHGLTLNWRSGRNELETPFGYDTAAQPLARGSERRLTENYGYGIQRFIFSSSATDSELTDFAETVSSQIEWQDIETTFEISEVSGQQAVEHYTRVGRQRAVEYGRQPLLPTIAFSIEESDEAFVLSHEYGDDVDAEQLTLTSYLESESEFVPLNTQPSDKYDVFSENDSLHVSRLVDGEQIGYMRVTAQTGEQRLGLFDYSVQD